MSCKPPISPLPDPDATDAIARAVDDAMRSVGWTLPQDEDAVAAAERDLADHLVDLPDSLTDATHTFDRAAAPDVTLRLPAAANPDIDAALARAAREGRSIPPHIEQRMREDRAAAESQADAQSPPEAADGEDVK